MPDSLPALHIVGTQLHETFEKAARLVELAAMLEDPGGGGQDHGILGRHLVGALEVLERSLQPHVEGHVLHQVEKEELAGQDEIHGAGLRGAGPLEKLLGPGPPVEVAVARTAAARPAVGHGPEEGEVGTQVLRMAAHRSGPARDGRVQIPHGLMHLAQPVAEVLEGIEGTGLGEGDGEVGTGFLPVFLTLEETTAGDEALHAMGVELEGTAEGIESLVLLAHLHHRHALVLGLRRGLATRRHVFRTLSVSSPPSRPRPA